MHGIACNPPAKKIQVGVGFISGRPSGSAPAAALRVQQRAATITRPGPAISTHTAPPSTRRCKVTCRRGDACGARRASPSQPRPKLLRTPRRRGCAAACARRLRQHRAAAQACVMQCNAPKRKSQLHAGLQSRAPAPALAAAASPANVARLPTVRARSTSQAAAWQLLSSCSTAAAGRHTSSPSPRPPAPSASPSRGSSASAGRPRGAAARRLLPAPPPGAASCPGACCWEPVPSLAACALGRLAAGATDLRLRLPPAAAAAAACGAGSAAWAAAGSCWAAAAATAGAGAGCVGSSWPPARRDLPWCLDCPGGATTACSAAPLAAEPIAAAGAPAPWPSPPSDTAPASAAPDASCWAVPGPPSPATPSSAPAGAGGSTTGAAAAAAAPAPACMPASARSLEPARPGSARPRRLR